MTRQRVGVRRAALGALMVSAALFALSGPSVRSAIAQGPPITPGNVGRLTRSHHVQVNSLPAVALDRSGRGRETKPFLRAPHLTAGPAPVAVPASTGSLQAPATGAFTGSKSADLQTRTESIGAAPTTAVLERLTTFAALGQNGKAPPDTQFAVGPDYVIEMVNITGQVYDSAGNLVGSPFDLGTFFGGSSFTGRGTDPRVLYDAPSGRFFAVYELLPAGGDAEALAVSDSSDPTAGWSVYSMKSNTSNVLQDQPKLGLSSDKVTVSWNEYDSAGNFTQTYTDVIQKAGLLARNASVPGTAFTSSSKFQIVPAYSLGSTGDQYAMWKSGTDVKVLTYSGVPGVSTVTESESSFGIGSADAPPAAAQPSGGDAIITTNDDRMLSVTWQGNHLWGVFNVKCTPTDGTNTDTTTRACLRYTQVSTAGGLTLVTNFNLGMIGGDLYFGAVSLDSGNDLFSGFTASSSTLYPTAVAIGVPGGNFQPVTSADFFASGTQAYICGCGKDAAGTPKYRWGDYSGIARDPAHPTDVWVGEEIGGLASGFWGTSIGRFTLSGPAVSSINPTNGPELSACVTNVVIDGENFVTGGTSVKFGTTSSPSVFVSSPNRLTARAPSHARGAVDVTVTTADGTSPVVAADQFTYDPDTIAPTTTASIAPTPVGGWNKAPATVNLSATDTPCGSGVQGITYSATGAQTISATTVSGASTSVAISNEGSTTVSFAATDRAGNVETTGSILVKVDNTAPTITCGTSDGVWHATDVSIDCTASDTASGLANPADATFSLVTSVPTGTETADAATGTRVVCDAVGNCATAGPITGNQVDKKAPSITVTTPPAGEPYLLNQTVAADYGCADGGSGVATCTGPVPDGGSVDTSAVGTEAFTVDAADNVGNVSSSTATYRVTYQICLQYDPTKALPAAGVFPIRLQLCDANGANVSSASITVQAVSISPSEPVASLSNTDGSFTMSKGTYVYNLSVAGFPAGTYTLSFTVSGDPVTHEVPFVLK